jgi:hypothetical protein
VEEREKAEEHQMRVEGEKIGRRNGDEGMSVEGRSDQRRSRPRGSTITGTNVEVEEVGRKETISQRLSRKEETPMLDTNISFV